MERFFFFAFGFKGHEGLEQFLGGSGCVIYFESVHVYVCHGVHVEIKDQLV